MKNKIKEFLIKLNIISELTLRRIHKRWIRVICDEEIEKFINRLNYKSLSTLEISGKRWQLHIPGEKYESLYYPEFDISHVENFQKIYDLIILEHVLEHFEGM